MSSALLCDFRTKFYYSSTHNRITGADSDLLSGYLKFLYLFTSLSVGRFINCALYKSSSSLGLKLSKPLLFNRSKSSDDLFEKDMFILS